MATGTNRDVNLNIRATDSTGPGVKSATTALQRFAAAQKATQARRDLYANTEKSARDLAEQANAAAEATALLGKRLSDAKRPSAQLKEDFAAARAETRRLKEEFMAAAVAGGRLNGKVQPTGSFAAFERTVEALRSERVAADAADDAINRLSRDLSKADAAQRRFAGSTEGAAAAGRKQGAAGGGVAGDIVSAYTTKSDRGPLGLRPYELQNLSYQINDFFTQIASGTPATQAFAQQFGQVAQLFPAAISGFLRISPAIALATAALSPFVSALIEVENKASSLKTFDILLTSVGNGAVYSKERLADLAATLDDYGGSLEDARTALSIFVRDDVAPAYLERFGKAALNLSKVMKIDVSDAAGQVSKAFTGNISDILALDDSINFLSTSERAHIEVLKKSGKEAEARTQSFAIFERRYDETAAKMRGNWSTILKNFDGAWKGFVDWVNFIDFSKVREELNSLLGLVAKLTAALPGATARTHQTVDAEINRIVGLKGRSQAAVARGGSGANASRAMIADYDKMLADLHAERDRMNMRASLREIATAPPAAPPKDTTLDPPTPPKLAKEAQSDSEKAAERLAKAQKEFNSDLENANASRARGLELLGETARETAILQAIEEARKRAADGGLVFSKDQENAIRASVGAVEDATAQQEAFNRVSEAALELATRRGEVETRDAYISRTLVDEKLTKEMALYAIRADQLGQLYDLEQKARDREASEKSVNDLLTQQSELQTQLTFAQEQGDQSAASILAGELDAVNARLLLAIDNSISFWRSIGGPEAAAAILALQGARERVVATGKAAVVTGKDINSMIAQGGANAFDQFSQKVADGENVIKAFGDSFLQMAADFLKQIAMMIAQQAILNAIGGGSGGGGVGAFVAGLFRHNGGLVGTGGGFRRINPVAMLGAVQYHTGGIAGQKPDEVSAMLRIGEEVLTEDDPRHRKNLGKGGGGQSTKIVNVFDPADLLEKALSTEAGERVFLNWVRSNGATFKAAVG